MTQAKIRDNAVGFGILVCDVLFNFQSCLYKMLHTCTAMLHGPKNLIQLCDILSKL